MNCARCGGPIGNKIIRYNGVTLCENCAREVGVEDAFRSQTSLFEQAFPMFEEMASAVLGTSANLEFANTKIRCPRCKMTLREFETGGKAGCIECFNTFNETILKSLLKRQGSSEYKGRKPGEIAFVNVNSEIKDEMKNEETDEAIKTSDSAVTTEKINKSEQEKKIEVVDSKSKALVDFNVESLENFSDAELEEGMKMAAKEENYALAMRLRDELKKRKEDN